VVHQDTVTQLNKEIQTLKTIETDLDSKVKKYSEDLQKYNLTDIQQKDIINTQSKDINEFKEVVENYKKETAEMRDKIKELSEIANQAMTYKQQYETILENLKDVKILDQEIVNLSNQLKEKDITYENLQMKLEILNEQ